MEWREPQQRGEALLRLVDTIQLKLRDREVEQDRDLAWKPRVRLLEPRARSLEVLAVGEYPGECPELQGFRLHVADTGLRDGPRFPAAVVRKQYLRLAQQDARIGRFGLQQGVELADGSLAFAPVARKIDGEQAHADVVGKLAEQPGGQRLRLVPAFGLEEGGAGPQLFFERPCHALSAMRDQVECHGYARLLRAEGHGAVPHIRREQGEHADLRLYDSPRRHGNSEFGGRYAELQVPCVALAVANFPGQRHIESRTDPALRVDVVGVIALALEAHRPCAGKSESATLEPAGAATPVRMLGVAGKRREYLAHRQSDLLLQHPHKRMLEPEQESVGLRASTHGLLDRMGLHAVHGFKRTSNLAEESITAGIARRWRHLHLPDHAFIVEQP